MRILIVKTSSMGDVVHALPLAADIARARPNCRIDWLVEESFADIPAMSRHVAAVPTVALRRWRRSPFSRSTRDEVARIRQGLRDARYDLVIDAQGLLKSAWVARWAKAPIAGLSSDTARERIASRLYSRRLSVDRSLHAIDRVRRLGALALGYAIEGPPRFDLSVEAATLVNAPYAVLLTNASRASKLWPEANWIAVADWIAEQGFASQLVWGTEHERHAVEALAARMRRASVLPRSSLLSLAATLHRAALVVGLDTGLSHLAAALGRPTVGIYCDYDPRLVGLVGDGPVASLGGVDQKPTVTAVTDAARRVMEQAS